MGSITPPYVALSDNPARRSDATRWPSLARQLRSQQLVAAKYTDAGAGLEESWANTGNWFLNGGAPIQASGGYAYAGTTSNTAAATCTSMSMLNNPSVGFHMKGVLKVVTNSNSTYSLVGLSKDAPGAAPASGLTNVYVAIGYYNGGFVFVSNGGVHALTASDSSAVTAGTYVFDIWADENFFSATIVPANAGAALTCWTFLNASFSRTLFASTQYLTPWILLEDTTTTAGCGVGPLYIKQGNVTGRPGFGIDNRAFGFYYLYMPLDGYSAGSSAQLCVMTPVGHDFRRPTPMVLCFHSSGGGPEDYLTQGQKTPVTLGLLQAGYIVVQGTSNTSSNSTWGNRVSLDTHRAAYKWAREHLNPGPTVLLATSMGGIESLLTLAERRIPDVAAWAGISPTYDQISNYLFGGATFRLSQTTAYGATLDALQAAAAAGATSIQTQYAYTAGQTLLIGQSTTLYEKVTVTGASTGSSAPYTTPIAPLVNSYGNGLAVTNLPYMLIGNNQLGVANPDGLTVHDPAQLPASAMRGVPMLIAGATDDLTVSPAGNSVALNAAMQGVGVEVLSYPGITGGHVYAMPADVVTAIVGFFNKYAGQ